MLTRILFSVVLLFCATAIAAEGSAPRADQKLGDGPVVVALEPENAGPDFAVQGEYPAHLQAAKNRMSARKLLRSALVISELCGSMAVCRAKVGTETFRLKLKARRKVERRYLLQRQQIFA